MLLFSISLFSFAPQKLESTSVSSLSMQQSWSRSRTTRRTRSSSEKLSNTVTSSRYRPPLQQHQHPRRQIVSSPEPCSCFLVYQGYVTVIKSLTPQATPWKLTAVKFGFCETCFPETKSGKAVTYSTDVTKCIQGSLHCSTASA